MVKVRILSGNEAGAIKEMSQPEAEANTATGFAELVVDPKNDQPAVLDKKAPEPVKSETTKKK